VVFEGRDDADHGQRIEFGNAAQQCGVGAQMGDVHAQRGPDDVFDFVVIVHTGFLSMGGRVLMTFSLDSSEVPVA
jgi:hypothetical protein